MGVVWSPWWFEHKWEFIWKYAGKESTNYSNNTTIQTFECMKLLIIYSVSAGTVMVNSIAWFPRHCMEWGHVPVIGDKTAIHLKPSQKFNPSQHFVLYWDVGNTTGISVK